MVAACRAMFAVYACSFDEKGFRQLNLHPGRRGIPYAGVAAGSNGLSKHLREE